MRGQKVFSRRWAAISDNPIIRREMGRISHHDVWWPGWRFYLIVLLVYPIVLIGLAGCAGLVFLAERNEVKIAAGVTGFPIIALFSVAAWLLSWGLPWIAPALTASTIARERERGTLDLLRATLLSERSIVLSKLGARLLMLWPGIFLLLILAPFQIIGSLGLGGCFCPGMAPLGMMPALYGMSDLDDWRWIAAWLISTLVLGTLQPLANLAFHAAIGVFISALAASSGAAVVLSYGAVIAVRAFIQLITSLLGPVVIFALLEALSAAIDSLVFEQTSFWMLSVLPFLVVMVEFISSVVLVWAAAWRLKRT